jgi:hypothetical protein
VRGSIILNYVVTSSIEQNIPLLSNFCKQTYLKHVFNWALLPRQITNPHLCHAIEEIGNIPVSGEDMPGRPWLLGYIESMYQGNIVTSINGKWIALINDSITSFIRIHRVDETRQVKDRTIRELRRMILTPARARPNTAPNLEEDVVAMELVGFHRTGFQMRVNQVLDAAYIDANAASYHHFIRHFGCCMQRQTQLKTAWNQRHAEDEQIKLKKRMPLTFFGIGSCKSVQIDRKGLYYILSQYLKENKSFLAEHPPFPTSNLKLDIPFYRSWMLFMFRLDKLLDG